MILDVISDGMLVMNTPQGCHGDLVALDSADADWLPCWPQGPKRFSSFEKGGPPFVGGLAKGGGVPLLSVV